MEFEGIGTIPYEAPPEYLKPFFRRKYATVVRTCNNGMSYTTRAQAALWADSTANRIQDLEERKKCIVKLMSFYDRFIFYGREKITEKEYVEERVKEAFGEPKLREQVIREYKDFLPDQFDAVDTNSDGHIDFEEFSAIYKFFNCKSDTIKLMFDTIDANKDGVISLEEYTYANLYYQFCSGPDSVLSSMAGTVVEDEG